MSRPAPRRLEGPLRDLTTQLAPATPLARVQEIWEQVLGPTIAAAAQPAGERDGVLTVRCTASVWAQELELMGPELVERLNAGLDAATLRRVRCLSG